MEARAFLCRLGKHTLHDRYTPLHTQGHRLGKHIVSATAVTEEVPDNFQLLSMIGS